MTLMNNQLILSSTENIAAMPRYVNSSTFYQACSSANSHRKYAAIPTAINAAATSATGWA